MALVIGANDVVTPVARTDKSSQIYGMPILSAENTRMLYGSAQQALKAASRVVRVTAGY